MNLAEGTISSNIPTCFIGRYPTSAVSFFNAPSFSSSYPELGRRHDKGQVSRPLPYMRSTLEAFCGFNVTILWCSLGPPTLYRVLVKVIEVMLLATMAAFLADLSAGCLGLAEHPTR